MVSVSNAQTLYKSVGPDGKVVYSDKPPTEGRIDKTMKFENLPSSTVPASTLSYVEQLRRMRASAGITATPRGVVLYSATWCGYCSKAKAYLATKGVAYQAIDIDTDTGKESFAHAGGGKGIPLLIAGDQRIQGFSPQAYDAMFASRKSGASVQPNPSIERTASGKFRLPPAAARVER